MKNINFRILSLFAFVTFSWGLGWSVNKVGLAYVSPLWYTTLRLLIGTATMMSIVFATKRLTWPRLEEFPLILTIGLLQISVYILFANLGLAYLPAGRSSLLAYTTPLWVMPVAILFFGEEAGWMRWLGFILGVAGLIILLSPWDMDWNNRNVLFGSGMLILASLCWAISMLCARYMNWTKSPLELVPWQLLVGTVPILIYACIKEPMVTIHWNPALILSLIYTGALVTGLSYWSGIVINKELPTIAVSVGFLVVPVFSLVVSALFMHEQINLPTGMAMALIMVGLFFVAA